MKSNLLKILVGLLAVCVLVGLGYQIYLHLSFPYETSTTYSYTLENTADGQGMVFKDETVITGSGSGVVNYLYINGSKVAKGAEVARVYQNEQDVVSTAQIEQLNKQISELQAAQSPGASEDANIEVVQKQLESSYTGLLKRLQGGDLTGLSEDKESLAVLFNKKQIITGQAQDFNDTINQLSAQKSQLEASITSQPQPVTVAQSGYFVDSADGLEQTCTLAAADALQKADLQKMLSAASPVAPQGSIGKLITAPYLKVKTLLPTVDVADVSVGGDCTLRFPDFGITTPAVILDLQLDDSSDQSMVTLQVTGMNEQLASVRSGKVEVVLDSATGLRIPKTAVRTNGSGESGVYSVNGVSMQFKKLDIVYEDNEYVLSRPHSDDASYLRLYDTIIVQGKDLYDNKPIR